MATSGSKQVTIFSSWLHLKFSWEQNSQSAANNTTTIGWKMELISGNGSLTKKSRKWTVSIDGTQYTGTVNVSIAKNSTQTLASGTATINHNTDGSKVFSYSFSQEFDLTLNNGNYMGTYQGSGSDTLTTIARASQPSLVTYPNTTNNIGNFGEEFSIHMNSASQSFRHTVRYSYGNRSGTIAKDVVNGTKWAVPVAFMNDIPNSTSASGRIYVDTYDAFSRLVGTKYTGFTVTVPASVKPSCAFTLDDITGVDSIYGSPVKGLSKIKVTVNAQTAYSSPIDTCRIVANGAAYSGTTATTGVLKQSGNSVVTATVTDARGRSGSVSYTMNVQNYSAPAITALSVHRCDEDGTSNDRGEFVKVTFSATVSSMSNKNTATYSLLYKQSTDSVYTEIPLDGLRNNYAVSNYSYIFEADGSNSYDVMVSVTDRHNGNNPATRSTSASTAFTLINYHPQGDAIRFGGVAEMRNAFQNDLTFIQTGNQYCYYSEGTSGVKGYVAIAQIEITHTNANAPITFNLTRRNSDGTMTVHVRFQNVSTKNPGLDSIVYEGQNYGAFLYQISSSVWTLYVEKTSQNDPITLQSWSTSMFMDGRILVTFPGGQVDSLPNPYYRATPAVIQSIIDCLLPVGMIIQLYSHADPNDMYPGTTWVRLVNTFLWGCDASGTIGQTGGEKTHALTVNELPAHSHGAVYSANAEGTKSQAWYSTSGDKLAYGVVETGGGQAHNNMPPYTQVSIWRRTG